MSSARIAYGSKQWVKRLALHDKEITRFYKGSDVLSAALVVT